MKKRKFYPKVQNCVFRSVWEIYPSCDDFALCKMATKPPPATSIKQRIRNTLMVRLKETEYMKIRREIYMRRDTTKRRLLPLRKGKVVVTGYFPYQALVSTRKYRTHFNDLGRYGTV